MPATIITSDDLRDFKIDLLDELKTLLVDNHPKTKKWLRSADVRDMLNISPGTLQNLRINGTIPYTKIGGVIFYNYQDITNMLEENKIRVA